MWKAKFVTYKIFLNVWKIFAIFLKGFFKQICFPYNNREISDEDKKQIIPTANNSHSKEL